MKKIVLFLTFSTILKFDIFSQKYFQIRWQLITGLFTSYNKLDISKLEKGWYLLSVINGNENYTSSFVKD